jgi:hypothetical protein
VNEEDLIFPRPILAELCPQFASSPNLPVLSSHIENYLLRLITHLISMKAQSKIIRESIVAISAAAGSSASRTTVTTRDACRAIRSFTGLAIPDLTSFVRLPQTAEAPSIQTSPIPSAIELSNLSPSMRTISEDALPGISELSKKRSQALSGQNVPKIPRKRGRPRKNPLPEGQ